MNDTPTPEQDEPNEKPAEGWIQIPVLRGIYEIKPLLDLIETCGGSIMGGYARFCCSTAERVCPSGDVDIFPIGNDAAESQHVYDSWVMALMGRGLAIKHENNVSSSWDHKGISPFDRCPTIQLIKPMVDGAIVTQGSIEEVLGNFDFTIVRVALNRDRETATAWASFDHDESRKRLRILNIHCPISSLLRVTKYGRKGYYMRPIEAMKLFADWQNRSPEYRARIAELFTTGELGKINDKEIDELERLLRVD